jgi:hypothetical protein
LRFNQNAGAKRLVKKKPLITVHGPITFCVCNAGLEEGSVTCFSCTVVLIALFNEQCNQHEQCKVDELFMNSVALRGLFFLFLKN